MSSEYEINVVRFPNRNQGFNAHVIRLQTRAAFNTEASLNVLLQYSSVSDQFSTNIRFRYNFREGNDLWLVYNQNLNTYRDEEKPRELLIPFLVYIFPLENFQFLLNFFQFYKSFRFYKL